MNSALHKKYQEVFENHWWFAVRDRILKDVLNVHTHPHSRILDFGCNYGHTVRLLQSYNYDVAGVDVSKEAIEYGEVEGVESIDTFTFTRVGERDADQNHRGRSGRLLGLDDVRGAAGPRASPSRGRRPRAPPSRRVPA